MLIIFLYLTHSVLRHIFLLFDGAYAGIVTYKQKEKMAESVCDKYESILL